MKDVEVEIKENKRISAGGVSGAFYRLSFHWDKSWGIPSAGNFCEIKVNNLSAPTLRRPFAFSGFDEHSSTAEIIYQKRGTATSILSNKSGIKSTMGQSEDDEFLVSFDGDFTSDKIKILAPLGNAFYYDPKISGKKRIFAVAGGVGLGPILFAAKTAPFSVGIVAGFRTAELIPDESLFSGVKTAFCTDDGSKGFKGNVVSFLERTNINSEDLIIACGPTPMLKALHKFAQKRGIVCRVSIEEMMACGIGACMGCVCETVNGNKRVCKEGPVFDSDKLIWQ